MHEGSFSMWHAKRLTLLKNVSLAPDVIAVVTGPARVLCSSELVSAHAAQLPAVVGTAPGAFFASGAPARQTGAGPRPSRDQCHGALLFHPLATPTRAEVAAVAWQHHQGAYGGARRSVRPKLMTVSTMMIGLVSLLWAAGSGADVMKRIAVPMVGGLATTAFLTLELIPVAYTYWRYSQLSARHFVGGGMVRARWNHADGWMSGWMGGWMWFGPVIAVLVVVLLVVAIRNQTKT